MIARFLFKSRINNFCGILFNQVEPSFCTFCVTYIFKCSSKRSFSSNVTSGKIEDFSKLSDYAQKQLFLTQHEETEVEETLKTKNLLAECQSPQDVLQLVKDQNLSNSLWDDELILYYRALKYTLQSSLYEGISLEHRKFIIGQILNDENFHVILRRSLLASVRIKSNDLAFIFFCLGKFQLPHSSFAVKFIVQAIQRRINDFFPKDVVLCNYALNDYKISTPEMQSLSVGLLMHLENLVCDEKFFLQTTSGINVNIAFRLIKSYSDQASPQLRKCLLRSIEETLQLNQAEGSLSLTDAIKVLSALYKLQYSGGKLIHKTVNVIEANADQLSDKQKGVVSAYVNGLQFQSPKSKRLLESFTETSELHGLDAETSQINYNVPNFTDKEFETNVLNTQQR